MSDYTDLVKQEAAEFFKEHHPAFLEAEGEFGGNHLHLLDALQTSATIASYASTKNPHPSIPFYRMMYLDLTLRLVIVYAMPDQAKKEAIQYINSGLARGMFEHRIARQLPLDQAVAGHELVEDPATSGCVVLTID